MTANIKLHADNEELDVEDTARHQDNSSKATRDKSTDAGSPPTPTDDDFDVSDLESDLEPEELQSLYLSTKSRLYEVQPELVDSLSSASRKKPSKNMPASKQHLRPGIAKLRQKLEKIEGDLLFDKSAAESQWESRRIMIAREQAERRRLQVARPDTPKSTSDHSPVPAAPAGETKAPQDARGTESDADHSDDNYALADLFTIMPSDEQEGIAKDSGKSEATTEHRICIRDFGQTKGVEPRRVLEDAIKSRDSGAKLVYKLVSSNAFSNRHCLHIQWSKAQEWDECLSYAALETVMRSKQCLYTMIQVATPDKNQSLALVSVFALFQISVASGREDKAYLRLPTAWKDFWNELTDSMKQQKQAAEKDEVQRIRALVESRPTPESDDDVVLTRNFKKRQDESGPRGTLADARDATDIESEMKSVWLQKASTPAFQQMLRVRQSLPMLQFREQALKTVEQQQVTIVCGETGCGKSTQMPSFLLEHEMSRGRRCKIYCTEPRRISAITLAQRVSQELGENKRDVGTVRSLVGYAIRLESQVTVLTRLVYATTGIVLRMLESPDGFADITHVIIDEVHERSIETDFLLIILRSLIVRRPDLKVVLMSATVDAQKFSSYFGGAPVLNVPGRTFPVKRHFLEDAVELTGHVPEDDDQNRTAEEDDDSDENGKEDSRNFLSAYSLKTRATLAKWNHYRIDYNLIFKLILTVSTHPQYKRYSQAILVFLPGIAEIRRMNDILSGTPTAQQYQIHMLHSTISSDDQQAAFNLPPRGMGKIVLSTNIAETGVTIPDVTAVIDTGTHKEMRFDERRQISRLLESFISRANAKQRCGRAGRVQEGLCFHLFTKRHHDERMTEQQTPEMLRLSLQDLVMRVKSCKLGNIEDTLSQALDRPSSKNIRRAIDALVDVGALTPREDLTGLGHQLSKLPLDPYLGKLALFGAIFGCLDVALTLAALLSSQTPFVASAGAKKQADLARLAFKKHDSDLLTEFNAYASWRRTCLNHPGHEPQFCRKNCLSSQTLGNIEDIKAQLLTALSDDCGLVALDPAARADLSRVQNSGRKRSFVAIPAPLNRHADNADLVASVIAWSFYPKLLVRDGKGWRNVGTSQSISVHPSSVLRQAPPASPERIKFLSFYSILQSGGAKTYNANSLTPVAPLALALMVGAASWYPTAFVMGIDGARLRFAVEAVALRRKAGGSGNGGARGESEARDPADELIGPWKTYVALKFLRRRLEEIVQRRWKKPADRLPFMLQRWADAWDGIVEGWAA